MRKTIFLFTIMFSVLCSLCSVSYAAIPHLINYQGRLTDSSGVPLNGSYNLTFRIYDAETAGTLLWEETHLGALIQKGIFSLLLGSVTNLDLPFDRAYWLEIKVGNEVMSPRQRIASSAYALRAEKAEGASVAQAVSPQGSGSNLDADKLDGKNSTSTDLKPLGAWVTKSANTVYQAATDGFVIAYLHHYTSGTLQIFTDSSNPPTTMRASQSTGSGTTEFGSTCTVPVKKNDYYKIYQSGGDSFFAYWIPLGD